MGKASKWIINLLLGRKEDKFKQIDSPEKKNGNNVTQIVSPKVKRRWSFGKLTGGKITSKVTGHKISRSFNSSDSAKLQIQALFETKSSRRIPTSLPKSSKRHGVKTAAATTIQAAFRSYLARKALHALRGLVKLQALVRGHLVRKQTTATLRGMHALMAIQVRARINRIQMVEEANLLAVQPPQYRETPHFKGLIKENDSKDMSLEEMLEILKSRSGPLDDSDVTSRGHDSMAFYSKQMSASKRENQFKGNTLIIDPNNSPGNYQTISEMNPTTTVLSTQRHQVPHRQSWSPNYMNKTESSKAKVRSQSEPRQRPKRGTRHKSKSVESPSNGPSQHLFTNSSRFDQGSLDHWVINVHESMKDNKRDSFGSSTATSDWYY